MDRRKRAMGFARHEGPMKTSGRRRIAIPADFRHALCIGPTGSGKTVGVVLPALEDRIAAGHGMLIYVYKGHEHARIKALARRHGRLDDVVEFGVPHGMQINLMASFDSSTLWRVIFDLCGGDDGERNSYWSYGAA